MNEHRRRVLAALGLALAVMTMALAGPFGVFGPAYATETNPEPTVTATVEPTDTGSPEPTVTATVEPTQTIQPTGTPTTSPSVTDSPQPTTSASTPNVTPTATAVPVPGGDLPVTGARTMVLAGGGVAMALGGVLLYLGFRRRKVEFTA